MRKLTALLAAGLVLGTSGMAMAAVQDATAAANTEAVIVKPITLSNVTNLYFGRLASVAGTVTISESNGARTSTNDANLVAAVGTAQAPSRATFAVAGEKGLSYSIIGGTGNLVLKNGDATPAELTVALTGAYVLSKTAIALTGTLDATAGTDTLGVGGSLPILATTPSGTYTNTGGISLTVAYN